MTTHTKTRATLGSYESPTGSLVRFASLGVAIGFSLLAGAIALATRGDFDVLPVWIVWIAVLVVSILVYSVASFAYRTATFGQSRRMQRWLRSGTR